MLVRTRDHAMPSLGSNLLTTAKVSNTRLNSYDHNSFSFK